MFYYLFIYLILRFASVLNRVGYRVCVNYFVGSGCAKFRPVIYLHSSKPLQIVSTETICKYKFTSTFIHILEKISEQRPLHNMKIPPVESRATLR